MYTLEFESVELECQEEELTEFQFKDSQHSDNITSLIWVFIPSSVYVLNICFIWIFSLTYFSHIHMRHIFQNLDKYYQNK